MRIHVRHIDDETVEVTLTPSWVRRLFGARARCGIARRDECDGRECGMGSGGSCRRWHWWWKATDNEVDEAIEREIECTTIEDVPPARLVAGTADDPERGWQ